MARPRSKKRSWRQGQKRKAKKFFKQQARRDERRQDRDLARSADTAEEA